MLRLALFVLASSLFAGACHTVPDPNDPARQGRIDDCLKQCGSADAPSSNTAYASDPLEQRDTRTPCEKRCHQIP